jgi:hypothetical protein
MISCSYFELSFVLIYTRQKIKFTVEQAMKAQWDSNVQLYSFFSLGARWGDEWSTQPLGRSTPGKETRYPLYKRLGGPQGQSLR